MSSSIKPTTTAENYKDDDFETPRDYEVKAYGVAYMVRKRCQSDFFSRAWEFNINPAYAIELFHKYKDSDYLREIIKKAKFWNNVDYPPYEGPTQEMEIFWKESTPESKYPGAVSRDSSERYSFKKTVQVPIWMWSDFTVPMQGQEVMECVPTFYANPDEFQELINLFSFYGYILEDEKHPLHGFAKAYDQLFEEDRADIVDPFLDIHIGHPHHKISMLEMPMSRKWGERLATPFAGEANTGENRGPVYTFVKELFYSMKHHVGIPGNPDKLHTPTRNSDENNQGRLDLLYLYFWAHEKFYREPMIELLHGRLGSIKILGFYRSFTYMVVMTYANTQRWYSFLFPPYHLILALFAGFTHKFYAEVLRLWTVGDNPFAREFQYNIPRKPEDEDEPWAKEYREAKEKNIDPPEELVKRVAERSEQIIPLVAPIDRFLKIVTEESLYGYLRPNTI